MYFGVSHFSSVTNNVFGFITFVQCDNVVWFITFVLNDKKMYFGLTHLSSVTKKMYSGLSRLSIVTDNVFWFNTFDL